MAAVSAERHTVQGTMQGAAHGTSHASGTLTANLNLSVDITPELYELLNELVRKTGTPAGDVIRNALVLLDLAVDTVRNGGTVTVNEVVEPDKPLRTQKITGFVVTPDAASATAGTNEPTVIVGDAKE